MAKKGEFDKKYLEGLKMTGSVSKKGEDKKSRYFPTEKPATEEDVLSFEDMGTQVKIVLNDGKKYFVKKG